VSVLAAYGVIRLPLKVWQRLSAVALIVSGLLLIIIFIPGVGRRVNGSLRWIGVGILALQVSEFVKLAVIVYLADYAVRHEDRLRHTTSGVVKPLCLLAVLCGLLLLEPDFGATIVLMATALGMLFLAGARLRSFLILIGLVLILFAGLAVVAPYRFVRLTAFLHPWATPYHSGYQLTQSLIAFGRGGIWGVGLGNSVQKLFYLPEAYTDFLFAVLAEELGLWGSFVVVGLFTALVGRILLLGRRAQRRNQLFAAYLSYGVGLWLGLQTIINIGVNIGLLPTKGLTLPLMSYGGSSLLISCVAIAMVIRVDYELRELPSRWSPLQRFPKR